MKYVRKGKYLFSKIRVLTMGGITIERSIMSIILIIKRYALFEMRIPATRGHL